MKIEEKYSKAFNEVGGTANKLDRLLFEVELNLSKQADKRGKVAYQAIFEEITNARIAIHHLL
jgi:hypothetical protein